MRIFITGATGFIGSHIVKGLLDKGHELICLTHSRNVEQEGVETIHGDITDKESLKPMKACDAVIANASIYMYNPPKDIKDQMYGINVGGTKNTLELALEYGIPKIVFTSSLVAIGDTTKIGIASEQDLSNHCGTFTSLYEKTKHDSHKIAQKMIDEQNAPITIAMPGAVFGENDHSALGSSMRQLVQGRLMGIPTLLTKKNLIHVEDVAEGIILCLENGKAEPYLLTGPIENNLTDAEFISKVAEFGDLTLPKQKLTKGAISLAVMLYGIKQFLTGKRQFVSRELFNVMKMNLQMTNEKAVKESGICSKTIG